VTRDHYARGTYALPTPDLVRLRRQVAELRTDMALIASFTEQALAQQGNPRAWAEALEAIERVAATARGGE
jgi:hypothetical protein